jgi:membrane protease YdiL (CAAX protease family)
MKDPTSNNEKLSTWKILLLSLWPVSGFLVNMISEPIVTKLGLAPLYVNVPRWAFFSLIQLGFLYYLGKRLNGRYILKGIVKYRQAIPWWEFILFAVLLFAWAYIALMLLNPISTFLRESVFSWIYASDSAFDPTPYSRTSLMVMAIIIGILNPLGGGVVEELYYRGYLLPRMVHWGKWAPILNVTLWASTHILQPWAIPGFILAFLPMAFFAQWRKNIYVGMLVHTLGNLINVITISGQIF